MRIAIPNEAIFNSVEDRLVGNGNSQLLIEIGNFLATWGSPLDLFTWNYYLGEKMSGYQAADLLGFISRPHFNRLNEDEVSESMWTIKPSPKASKQQTIAKIRQNAEKTLREFIHTLLIKKSGSNSSMGCRTMFDPSRRTALIAYLRIVPGIPARAIDAVNNLLEEIVQ